MFYSRKEKTFSCILLKSGIKCTQMPTHPLLHVHIFETTDFFYFSYFRNSEGQQLGIDVALLRPLYQLYTNMTKQESEPGSILPPVTRALTELFLQVENLAIVSNLKKK